ncbi:hypothetical protein O3M35_007430 [Rhynocoris fuscipes]|uniref:Transcription factor Adf-1 n=1 Tax=Rhynocoris fuscipes TaxID=488301 RepID=A0AAW1DD12_9HEMI
MDSSQSTTFHTHKLISLVKANKCLYDQRDMNHNNRAAVNSVWKAIAVEMNQPESVCREKWINLRSNYARELRKTRRKINEMDSFPIKNCHSQWAYYNSLSFLSPFVKTRFSNQTTISDNNIRIKVERFDNIEEDPLNLVEIPDEVSSSENDRMHRWLAEIDDDRLFLLSLLPKMKQLNTIDNFKFRVEVQNLLLNRLQEHMNRRDETTDPLATDSDQ